MKNLTLIGSLILSGCIDECSKWKPNEVEVRSLPVECEKKYGPHKQDYKESTDIQTQIEQVRQCVVKEVRKGNPRMAIADMIRRKENPPGDRIIVEIKNEDGLEITINDTVILDENSDGIPESGTQEEYSEALKDAIKMCKSKSKNRYLNRCSRDPLLGKE